MCMRQAGDKFQFFNSPTFVILTYDELTVFGSERIWQQIGS